VFQIKNESTNQSFYATQDSAGFDVCACEALTIPAGEWKLVKTGMRIMESVAPELHELKGLGKILPELQIRPRSGLAAKFGITVLNSPATIDADYRGEIQVMLVNFGKNPFQIEPGDRIAQAVVALVFQIPSIPVKTQERGEGGFGSSGIKSS
jgi:dUTP pyrophosphatase